MEGCLACDLAEGRRPLPGGVIHATPGWLVEHCVGPLGVGTLVVKPRRHVVHVAELGDDEAAELGPLLRRTARHVSELTAPEQVYVTLWSHAGGRPGHIHWVVQPVTRAQMTNTACTDRGSRWRCSSAARPRRARRWSGSRSGCGRSSRPGRTSRQDSTFEEDSACGRG
jgi:diadenosine tetraphosphate (Ap4A) HIT family hydrolase